MIWRSCWLTMGSASRISGRCVPASVVRGGRVGLHGVSDDRQGGLDVRVAGRAAHACARQRFWMLHGTPVSLTIDIDAALILTRSQKEGAAGNYKGGCGFHPLHAYADQTHEALAATLRPRSEAANTAADHMTVLDLALEQIPAERIAQIEILVRADRAGATHELADYCRDGRMRFSSGYDLTSTIRQAIVQIPRTRGLRRSTRMAQSGRTGRWRRSPQNRPIQLAKGLAGDRATGATASRSATVVHRPRRVSLPSDPHRPGRQRHRGVSAPAASATTRTQ